MGEGGSRIRVIDSSEIIVDESLFTDYPPTVCPVLQENVRSHGVVKPRDPNPTFFRLLMEGGEDEPLAHVQPAQINSACWRTVCVAAFCPLGG
jgi:hypothetical protein